MRELLQPPPLADVMPDEDVSWSRLVIAIVLLALSAAIGYRTERDPPPPPGAVPQPVRERVVAGTELAPLARPAVDAAPPLPHVPERATHAPPKAVEHSPPPRARERRHVARAAPRASGPQGVRARRHQVAFAQRGSGMPGRSVRTRAQVRGEYLRARAVVAAFTGEDSGSAYLMQAAARQRAARPAGAARRRG